MAEVESLEPVSVIKENGVDDKETSKDPKDEVAIEEKANENSLEEMQPDKDPAKDSDTIDEKVNESDKVEHNGDLKEEKNEEDKTEEKNDAVAAEGKKSDTAKKSAEATETAQLEVKKGTETEEREVDRETETETEGKDVEKETETEVKDMEKETETEEKADDTEGKKHGVVALNGISAEGQESGKDDEEEEELKKLGKGKSRTKKANGKSKEVQEPKTPAAASFSIDRPVRERKSVERLVAISEQDSSKEFHIEKGNGTALKDISNVAYKFSRRKSDDTLKILHSILFSRRGKAEDIKQHILNFSGFVWHGDEDKQKLKIKEKLEKINKEKLFEFCEILDIAIASKANIRKDEVVTMLLDFLITPHASTDELLSEKEQSSKGSKRKRAKKETPESGSTKSRKMAETSKSDDKTNSAETKDESAEDAKDKKDGEPDDAVTGPDAKETTEELPKKSSSEEKPSEPDAQTDEDIQNNKRKRIPKKQIEIDEKTPKRASNSKKTTSTVETSKAKTKKGASLETKSRSAKATSSSSKKPKVDADKDTSPKVSSKKQKDAKPVKEKGVAASKEKAIEVVVSKGKEKTGDEQVKPTDARIRDEVCKILKEVDFNTATFTDILKILGKRFKTDLTPRKSVIKVMIQEELTKLANEETDDDEDKKTLEEVAPSKVESHTSVSQKL